MSKKNKKPEKIAKNTEKGLTAVNMRVILTVSLFAILIAMAVGFYFAYTSLEKTAQEASKIQTEAKMSDAKVQNLALVEKQLKENSFAYDRAKQIVADSQSYQYQNQIINDLTYYANQAHVGISSFTFQDSKADGSKSSGSTAPAAGETAPKPAANTVKSTVVSVQLGKDVAYQDLLHFLYLIEQNLTRMQVSDIAMSKGEAPGTVSAQELNIEVYIR